MSDVSQAIERREGDSLSQILGTGDTRAALERLERNARDVIDLARARGHVRRFGNAQTEHFGLPAWQLLGFTYGLVTTVEWSKPVDNGWEARASVRTRDGTEVGSAEAMCTRSETNWRNKAEHDVRAMSQTRARRNALRGVLGAFLVLTGFDFADPDAPANDDQVGILHLLERQLGWSHQEGHSRAGVASYRDLSREAAHETIEAWSELVDVSAPRAVVEGRGGRVATPPRDESRVGADTPSSESGINAPAAPAANTGGRDTPPPDSDTTSAPSRAGQRDPATPADNPPLDAVRDGATGLGADIPSATEQLGSPLPSEAEAAAGGEATAVHGPSSVERGGATDEVPPPAVISPASPADWEQATKTGLTAGRALKRARDRHRAKDPLFPSIVGRASDLTRQQLEALIK